MMNQTNGYGGVTSNGLASVGSGSSASSLAMPAIVSNSPQSNQQQQPVNLYQQQLIKSAQQFIGPQQQQPQGLRQAPVVDSLYNGLQGTTSNFQANNLYASKPQVTYYGQQQANNIQSLYQPLGRQASQQQQQQHSIYQHSPIGHNGSLQHSPMSLAVRQMQTMQHSPIQIARQNGLDLNNIQLSPEQQAQQIMLPYQGSQQQFDSVHGNEFLQTSTHQLPVDASYLNQITDNQQRAIDKSWPQQLHHHHNHNHHQQQQQLDNSNVILNQSRDTIHRRRLHPNHEQSRAPRSRFSDRDSISTMSRLDQLDDRRSFTMRSQCTNVNNTKRYANQFSFFTIAGEALKRLIGLGGYESGTRLLDDQEAKQNLHRNMNLSVTNSATKSSNQNFTDSYRTGNSQRNSSNVMVIDSGENYYFKRRVFRFQLSLIRVISLICSVIVLFSPVVMLLIPKMEYFINNNYHDYNSDSNIQGHDLAGHQSVGIKHSVGLGTKQASYQQSYSPPQPQWRISDCGSECDGPLIGFVIRFIMLCVAHWALFARGKISTLPRIDTHRCLLISMAFLLTSAYWLFFLFRVYDKRYNDFEIKYVTIVQFATSMLESLILLHYLAVVLLELRRRKKVYCLKVVRSPDGASQYFSCGALSIQQCAQYVIEKYSKNFKQYGPYSEHLIGLEDEFASSMGGGKGENSERASRSRANSPAHSTRGDTLDARTGGRSGSRSSRHHSKSGASHHRSPSSSPIRSNRSKTQKKAVDSEYKQDQSKIELKTQAKDNMDGSNTLDNLNGISNTKESEYNENKQQQPQPQQQEHQREDDNNSGDQSSEGTSRLKESSLETIRAANSSSDLFIQSKPSSLAAQQRVSSIKSKKMSEDHSRHHHRDETESVRSGRSRRSTTRYHHRHRESDHHHHNHHSHRGHSSSRAEQQASQSYNSSGFNPVEDHERRLRKRKFRLLMNVQETFEQIKRIEEGK